MKPVKRLEIVIDAPYSDRVTNTLERHDVEHWTRVRGASGSNATGELYGDEITGISNQHVIVAACPPDMADAVIADIAKILETFRGSCMISDASWLEY